MANVSQEWDENKAGKYKGAKGGEKASHTFLPAIFFCYSKLFLFSSIASEGICECELLPL